MPRPVSSSEAAPLQFNTEAGELSRKVNIPNSKIAWLHTISDQAGAKFDIKIKDALGRVKFERLGFGTETEKSGELINLPTLLGEELEVEISNVKGGKNFQVFLN